MSIGSHRARKAPPVWLARVANRIYQWLGGARRAIVPPQLYLFELSTALWTAQCLHAVARLDIAGCLADAPRSAAQIAELRGLHAPSLYRVLRLLSAYGVFHEDPERSFALTGIGRRLLADVPDSARAMLVYNGQPWQTEPYAQLEYTLRTGQPAFDRVFGAPFFDFATQKPDVAQIFDEAMTSVAELHAAAIVGAYDFRGVGVLADVGGGNGTLLARVLAANEAMRGILFELPHVAPRAAEMLARAGVADRCDVRSGDFFAAVPDGADAYMLSHVLHDWDDTRCRAILRACRNAMSESSRLLVVDVILAPADNDFAQGKLADIQMLLVLSGRERTETEFRSLIESEGFAIRRVIRTAAPECIIEAAPRGVRADLRTSGI